MPSLVAIRPFALCVCLVMPSLLHAPAALAQVVIQPPNPVPPVPLPQPPPPPSMAVPPVPKMDAPPTPPVTSPRSDNRRSFNDRIVDCLNDDASVRLRPSQRAAYSRACANNL
jgi:hypothetical protein